MKYQLVGYQPLLRITVISSGEMLRWRTFFFVVIPFFSPHAEGMVRQAAPRFSCGAPFFTEGVLFFVRVLLRRRRGEKKSICVPQAEKKNCLMRRRGIFLWSVFSVIVRLFLSLLVLDALFWAGFLVVAWSTLLPLRIRLELLPFSSACGDESGLKQLEKGAEGNSQ